MTGVIISTCYPHNLKYDMNTIENKSNRDMGAEVAPYVTMWYNEKWFATANIVLVDFIGATGIVEVALDWNKRRVSPCYDRYQEIMKH